MFALGISMLLASAAFAGTADTLTTPTQKMQTSGLQANSQYVLRGDALASQLPITTSSVTGEQKIVVLLISFPSMPLLSSVTPQLLQTTYFGSANSVDSFLRESSYGTVWATGDVFGPFVLDADYFDQPLAVLDDAVLVASSQVDFTKYNRIVLVVPQSSAGLESGGLGTIGSETVPLSPQGSITASTTWLGDASAGSPTDSFKCSLPRNGSQLWPGTFTGC